MPMNMKSTGVSVLVAFLAFMTTAVGGSAPSSNPTERAGREGTHPSVLATLPLVLDRIGSSREVLLGSAACNSGFVVLDLRATGGAVEGLQRPFTQGIDNRLFFSAQDCPGVLASIGELATQNDCTVAQGPPEESINFVCDDQRNTIIRVVGDVLRAAISAGAGS